MIVVCYALQIYIFILIARIILSWVQAFGGRIPPALEPVVAVILQLTEPILGFARRYIPPIGGLDISPIFIFIALQLLIAGLCS